MEELKPCPFCQSEARLVSAVRWVRARMPHAKRRKARGVYWLIGCSDPNCILYLDKNFKNARLMFATRGKDFAIRRWNRRASDD